MEIKQDEAKLAAIIAATLQNEISSKFVLTRCYTYSNRKLEKNRRS